MRKFAAILALFLGAAAPPPAPSAPVPSVQVMAVLPDQGDLPDILTGYGTASPDPAGTLALTTMRDGQIAALAVTVGEAVTQGQQLLDFAASPAAVAAYQQAVDAQALARTQVRHAESLLAQHLATLDQVAQARKSLADAQTALAALQQVGGAAPNTLTAPFAGIVATIGAGPGDRVAAGTTLVSLVRTGTVIVTAGIEPGLAASIRLDQPVLLTPLAGGETLSGRVARIGAMLNPRSRLVDAIVAAPSGAPMPGTAWRADISVGRFHGWLVPRDAVLTDKDGTGVFQIADGHAVRVAVRVLGANGMTDAVSGDIDPRRKLVTQGNAELRDGMAIHEAADH